MTCSAAKIEANRRNAQKSTGPKTAAGKATARLNAFQHGMAGAGLIIGPGEDVALIERRTRAFVRDYHVEGETGEILAQRAAVLSVRMGRAMAHELVKVDADVAAARDQFDADRQAAIEGWIKALDTDDDPRTALDELGETLEGQAHLIGAWIDLRDRTQAGDEAAIGRASLWLDRPGLAEPENANPTLLDRIKAEVDRLLDRADAEGPAYVAAVAAGRDSAGILASFDPSPEAARARRYEAAAERGFYLALRELRRDRPPVTTPQTARAVPSIAPPPPRPAPRPDPAPIPEPLPFPPAAPASGSGLGSFRAVDLAPSPGAPGDRLTAAEFAALPRKPRPDLRALAPKRR